MTEKELKAIIEEVNAETEEYIHIRLNSGILYIAGDLNYHLKKEQVKPVMIAAKKALGEKLLAAFPERRFFHMTKNKCRVWFGGFWNLGVFCKTEIVCGLRIELTEEEKTNLLIGARIFA